MKMRRIAIYGAMASALVLAACAPSAPRTASSAGDASSAAPVQVAEAPYPTQVFYGDTHLHTMNSGDAIVFGTRITPEDALRFASGEKVTSSTGYAAQLERPLDFLVVSDHSEGIGTGRELLRGNDIYMSDPTLKRWHDMMLGDKNQNQMAAFELISAFSQGKLPKPMTDPELVRKVVTSVWQEQLATVERYNRPGKFTALIGYEWTSTPKGDNLHRIVIFRDGPDKVGKILPFSSTDSQDPEKLWAFLSSYEKSTGGQVLAIPHNGDLSNGLLFALTDFEGKPLTADYAKRRARWEPLTEVTQGKGDSESHPFLSPNDEFANFGHTGWDIANLDMSKGKTPDMYAGEYAREALKRGLLVQQQTGVNPFKFGMIGATDAHTGLSSAGERNWIGETRTTEPGAARAAHPTTRGKFTRVGWETLTGGYTAVWARANTREALFDAMMRKEVFGTTGTRLSMRFFGGWNFGKSDLSGDLVKAGYAKGVPMGGDLKGEEARGAPSFLVSTTKDPLGANLDRLQVVKGWIDADGKTHERVFNVVWGDANKRHLDADGKLPPVGDTVDISKASYTNTIGAAQLSTVWRDPEFDPKVRAFYYVRALEIPTPRWPVYDAVRFGAKLPEGARLKDQQRGYSSPIWYEPKG
jgi:hypothetical protein